jgi:hypothetical protein
MVPRRPLAKVTRTGQPVRANSREAGMRLPTCFWCFQVILPFRIEKRRKREEKQETPKKCNSVPWKFRGRQGAALESSLWSKDNLPLLFLLLASQRSTLWWNR